MMPQQRPNQTADVVDGESLLAGLGIDPDRLVPYLAAGGLPRPSPAAGASPFEMSGLASGAASNPAPAPDAGPVRVARGPLAMPTPIDPAALSASLAPFTADAIPLARAASGGSRAAPSRGDSADFIGPTPSPADPARDLSGIDAAFGLPATGPAATPWGGPPAFGAPSASSPAASGDASSLDGRFARIVERLERIAEQLDLLNAPGGGAPSRTFRGRIDA